MGVCSTMDITREDALRVIMDVIYRVDDDALEDVLYDLVGGENPRYDDYPGIFLNNFRIVSEYEEGKRSFGG